jgi:hypothetical protein
MKSYPHSRPSPTLGACRRERRSALPTSAIALSASELRREGYLIQPTQEVRVTDRHSVITIHQLPSPHFLIATREKLEIRLSSSQQTRTLFLIATFSAFLAQSLARQTFLPNKNNPACAPWYSRSGGTASATPLGWQAPDHHGHVTSHFVCACGEPLRN